MTYTSGKTRSYITLEYIVRKVSDLCRWLTKSGGEWLWQI